MIRSKKYVPRERLLENQKYTHYVRDEKTTYVRENSQTSHRVTVQSTLLFVRALRVFALRQASKTEELPSITVAHCSVDGHRLLAGPLADVSKTVAAAAHSRGLAPADFRSCPSMQYDSLLCATQEKENVHEKGLLEG